jgi:hypothetical protein
MRNLDKTPARIEGEIDRKRRLGVAWLVLCSAIALHVLDEALSGFLSVYNPTVLVLRQRMPWLPLPTFTFRVWLLGLSIGVAILLLISRFMFRGDHWSRVLAGMLALLMIANGLMHIVGTILGHSVSSVHFARPMPGFYSSPLLLGASVYLLAQLGKYRVRE